MGSRSQKKACEGGMGPLGGGRKKNNGSQKIAPPRAGEDSLVE